ncbi:MAG: adenine phosphoribosyltransferase [Bacteroidaceae bacterium]|jgi:adenine phosphoribosyltransferase|nr:adenine phosphoribosyltransferase [Bacteroidales bacterium]
MSKERLISRLRNIPDYPVKGVQFKDVTSWFMNPDDLKEIVDSLYEKYKDKGITKVCGIESRGFIVGSILAYKLNAGFIPIRKPGKLPFEKVSVEYEKEYGRDRLEMHKDAICPNDVVLIHDDLLATGGTLFASCDLVKMFKPKRIYVNCIIELTNFQIRDKFPADCPIDCIIEIDEFEGVN